MLRNLANLKLFICAALLWALSDSGIKAEITSAFEAVREHREWMKKNTPAPDSLGDEDLMLRALQIIDLRMQEPEALRILYAAASKVPEVAEYLNWDARLECDTLMRRKRAAFRGMADFLDKTDPGCYGARKIRKDFLIVESLFGDKVSAFDDLIRQQEEICSKDHSKKEKALLVLMKMNRLDHLSTLSQTDNPHLYPEIWNLEKQVLELYPISSTDTIADRMELYTQIASLKVIPSSGTKVSIMLGHEGNPYDNGTLYQYTGTNMDYPCNSGFYLDLAYQIGSRIYGEFHPASVCVAFLRSSFDVNYMPVGEDELEYATLINDFMELYYPSHSLEAKMACMHKAMAQFRFSGIADISKTRDELIDILKLSYGDTNTYFLNQLSQITTFAIFAEEDYKSYIDIYDTACEYICKDSLHKAAWLIFNYANLKFRDPQEGVSRMNALKDIYMRNHNGTLMSLKVGEELVNYFRNGASDISGAAEVYDVLLDDMAKVYGQHSGMCYLTRKDKFEMSATGADVNEPKILDEIITDAETHDFTGKEFTLKNLYSSKGEYLWSMGKFDKACAFYKSLKYDPDDPSYYRTAVIDATCRLLSGKDKRGAAQLAEKIRAHIEKDVADSVYSIAPNICFSLGCYYDYADKLSDAVRMTEIALENHDYQTNGSLDDEYFQISGMLAQLYEASNNRVAAARLIAKDREFISNMHHTTPTMTMTDYLLQSYYRHLAKNDFGSAFFYLQGAFTAIGQIMISSRSADLVMYSSGISLMQAATSLITRIESMYKEAQEYFESAEFKAFNVDPEELKKTISQWYPSLKSFMEEMEKGFPAYDPNYKTNPYYGSLLSSLGTYYQICEHDYAKAKDYMLKDLEIVKDAGSRKNIYFNLAALMKESGDSAGADKYLSLAYAEILDNPVTMTDEEKIGALSYVFTTQLKDNKKHEAIGTAREIYNRIRYILDHNFQMMSMTQQEQIFNSFGDPAWALAQLLEKYPAEMSGEVYDAVVYRTGMQLRSQQETRRLIMNSSNPDVRALGDSLAVLKNQLRQINITPDQWMSAEGNANYKKSTALNFAIEQTEMALLDLTADERTKAHPDVTWQMVRDALKPGECAVEFLFSETRIMALVIMPGCESPTAVKLCEWENFSQKMKELNIKNSAALAQRLYGENSPVDLYGMLWSPLTDVIGNSKVVYFTAPGLLHSISFNAIATPSGGYLLDKYDLRQLTTTAQLTFPDLSGKPMSAALVGDVLFDPSQELLVGKMPEATGARAIDDNYSLDDFTETDTRGAKKQYFKYLPFTGKEIDEISNTFGTMSVTQARRNDATELALRRICEKSPEVLHLATHGFFLSSELEAMHVPFMKRFTSTIGSAMQRSGVALANAEKTWKGDTSRPEENDGILTANEVSRLDLNNTRLVTLSACETALGGYNFEGVHGLTRGFKQAGAKSLLVSLWSVNDKSTSLFMTEFYRNWLDTGDRHTAYRDAMAAVRAQYPSPFYWAPFILLD